jgi:hypothetical protein
VIAAVLALFSAWCGIEWHLAFIPAVLFVASSAILYFLATQPVIEVGESYLSVGEETIRWNEVERIEATGWTSPLVLRVGLRGGRRLYLIHPGDVASSERLLRQVRQMAREAHIEGLLAAPGGAGGVAPLPGASALKPPRYRLLRPEDEQEVERLYQRLKTVGRLDSKAASDDRGE